ncbi:hypothetical protein CEUSTIGMA_g13568.t1 [Chlamydomonas eustigma]|uniref:C3H1-type domain-containing protein n=1 Tax=Chlamydomonas eustigma TaxID=1157962 RepID=A0A250XSX1_9CHLO|nr:hypothetical protein CEUSTIGMA_g13568.t1 [Chlamydomonas eustigma]|eukprot:GAX86155.1 hypothetical protein CEUSTIGMA_g13568.t1 [Chlamydomonas eustigma]
MDGAFPSQKGQDFADSESNYPGGQGGGRGAGRSGFRGTAENAKTKLCNRWMQGDCRFGDRCNFAHGEVELRAGHDQSEDMSNGGRGYGARGGRGYGYPARGVAPGRGYGGRGGYGGGFQMMGGYPAGYGMEQPHGGYEQRPSGADDQWARSRGDRRTEWMVHVSNKGYWGSVLP